MASMREMKRRKESIQSTKQITKAMKLVSSAKLQQAKERNQKAKPYFDKMHEVVSSIMEKAGGTEGTYLTDSGSSKNAVLVISGNRGLAGGYNSNIAKAVMEAGLKPENTVIYGVGRKGMEFLRRYGYEIREENAYLIDEPEYSNVAAFGTRLFEAYKNGKIGKIYIAYTRFKNAIVHIPTVMQLLPPKESEKTEEERREITPMNFEPEPEEVLELMIPQYINSMIYGALMESIASENGARMQAMELATGNADEMIETLSLAYNRARQGAITQELTEIISGAEALG